MCGLAGLSLAEPESWADGCLQAMTSAIAHRGPDSDGFFTNGRQTTLLGFRRLAIRDLDARANQPMTTASGLTTGVFNGEIYNANDLCETFCPGLTRRTSGDTEVLLEAFERHSDRILPDFNGMFAAALYDTRTDETVLFRDRMGKKPLYLYEGDGFVAFASELRCFAPFQLEFDPERLPYFLQFGHYPAPLTAFARTSQLRPGETVVIRDGRIAARNQWHAFHEIPWAATDSVDLDGLDRMLSDAVSIRTLSDVPVGMFLSGGIDSSLVAAALSAAGHRNIPAFTVAFDADSHNEAPFAAEVAKHLGLEQIQIHIPPDSLPDLVESFVDCYEQPYVDSSGLPSMALCRTVRQYVTVALSGDGGDEFFGGYQRYEWFQKTLLAQYAPATLRRLVARFLPKADPQRGPRLQRWLSASDEAGLYAEIMRAWPGPGSEILDGVTTGDDAPQQLYRDIFGRLGCDAVSMAQCADASLYIPGDLQVKMDRASMRYSLEVRCPLLDHRLASIGASLTSKTRLVSGLKTVLKSLLERHVPRELFDRPKKGFSVPMRKWLAGPLRELTLDSLRSQSFRECGWVNSAYVEQLTAPLESQPDSAQGPLWMLLVLALSLEHSRKQAQGPAYLEFGERASRAAA